MVRSKQSTPANTPMNATPLCGSLASLGAVIPTVPASQRGRRFSRLRASG